jgi:hypothetical protein
MCIPKENNAAASVVAIAILVPEDKAWIPAINGITV